MEALFQEVLRELGEDPTREGLRKTPARVSRALRDMTRGYDEDAVAILRSALFTVDNQEIVLVKDIDFSSLCEHHMLPFMGRAHVAYIPDGKVVGLSKIARAVDVYARRLQVQERLTNQVAEALREALDPVGVAVILEATHLCMVVRGVQKHRSKTITSAMFGVFHDNPTTRAELMALIR